MARLSSRSFSRCSALKSRGQVGDEKLFVTDCVPARF